MAFSMTLTPAQEDLVERTHRFAEHVIRPVADEYDRREEFPWPVLEAAAEEGFYNSLFYLPSLYSVVSGRFANETLTHGRRAQS
jgi:Acyl-CoA dehydrogenase, N-terminal domain